METKKYRQFGTVASGWVVVGICVVLLISLLRNWSGHSAAHALAYLTWMLAISAIAYAVLIRPYVLLDGDGVTIGNVWSDIRIPWDLVEDVGYRWGLRMYVKGRRHVNAWAVYAHQKTRPKRTLFDPGAFADRVRPVERVSSGSVAQVMQRTVLAFEDGVEAGRITPDPGAVVTRRVQWPLACVLGALVVLAVGLSLV